MPNKPRARVRIAEGDPRAARTTRALGQALIALIQERDFESITVQQILDRAGVGRTTFYAHYRNKVDVLDSSYEGLFGAFARNLERSPSDARLFPVSEFLAHVGGAQQLVAALGRDGRLDDTWRQFAGYIARIIETRLARTGQVAPGMSVPLVSRMLTGALVEMIKWWQEHTTASTPAEMDAALHRLAKHMTTYR